MILAIRTDQPNAELLLLDHAGKPIQRKSWEAGHDLSKQILAEIQKLLTRGEASFDDLTGIVVYEGPGGFTSLRIGISVANTLAYSLEIPVVGSSGEDWVKKGLENIQIAKTGQYVLPKYGKEPNITKPRK